MNKKLKLIYIIGIILLFFMVIIMVVLNYAPPVLRLKGEKTIHLNLNKNYEEQGYQIYFGKKDENYLVEIENNVNNKKLGQYEVVYKFNNKEIIRKVIVEDIEEPLIKLKGNKKTYVCEGSEYQEEGYTASDNYDGNLTKKVEVIKEKDKIIYQVEDSSNNKTIVTREIIYQDNTSPVIEIENEITIAKGSKYQDKYKAIDNCDGDITSKVKVSGKVDSKNIGEYKITYEVEDNSGNKSSKTKKVKVVEKKDFSGSVIYLTFDDGPSSDVTPKILDLLKEYNIKATFFVINHDNSTNKIIKRAYDEGHTIGLHSYTHKYSQVYNSDADYFADLEKIENKVISITGESSKIIRFPGGSSNTVSRNYSSGIMSRLVKEVENRGYIYQDWNVGSQDTQTQDPEQICKNVTGSLGKGYNIVLMHDYAGHQGTYESLPCIIEYGLDNGYTFYALDSSSPVSHHRVVN